MDFTCATWHVKRLKPSHLAKGGAVLVIELDHLLKDVAIDLQQVAIACTHGRGRQAPHLLASAVGSAFDPPAWAPVAPLHLKRRPHARQARRLRAAGWACDPPVSAPPRRPVAGSPRLTSATEDFKDLEPPRDPYVERELMPQPSFAPSEWRPRGFSANGAGAARSAASPFHCLLLHASCTCS